MERNSVEYAVETDLSELTNPRSRSVGAEIEWLTLRLWWWFLIRKAGSCASIALASRFLAILSPRSRIDISGICAWFRRRPSASRSSLTKRSSKDYETSWVARDGSRRLIAWSSTILPREDGTPAYIIATGIDITERKQLEKAILEISAEEQRRIGQDLHDGLGQHLTGIAFMSKVQEQKLAEKGLAEAAEAARIVKLVNEAINKTRELAHGLLPVISDAHGLMSALKRWAGEVEDLFKISCCLRVEEPVLIHDTNMSTHLFYRIAQEAVNNAIKHGQAKNIRISLSASHGYGVLSIENNGLGLPGSSTNGSGMGIQIMNYRARMIGGSLKVESGKARGITVTCQFPLAKGKQGMREVAHDR
jgi:signal transduction histidine kinase